ncbi:MAG TPA: M28 family metallopeptidase [Streptomyces sp.]|uniref:M28 family metallopeptidase n=1 Tax=Streptomyces sp. TaxID=1931 RepID=UPI002D6D06A8|nr:M28 family metallopeptidase [Streptomyces sp.]HZG04314.1 M28 family metallopeptidase [Streptomyces sp.]
MHAPLRRGRKRRFTRAVAVAAAASLATPLLLAASAAPASATPDPGRQGEHLARKLVRQAGAEGAMRHLRAFQAIARLHDDNRAAGADGHAWSAQYAGTLLKAAGYRVTYQNFDFVYRETLAEKLTVLTPERYEVPVKLMTYTRSTPAGGVEAAVAAVPVDADGTTGCTAGDFASGDFTGKIALIRRGGCTFAEKQAAAADAGAVGAVIYNNTDGELNGTIGDVSAGRIPTGGISREAGEALAARAAQGTVTVNLEIREFQEVRSTPNVIAETRGGDPDNVVMLGAHLDSVADGPGINDNASGSAGILEAALQLAKADRKGKHPNKVRFALWSAEELGLQGSEHYVANLPAAEREKIALYLNFDMIASPNYGLFVYDGDDSDGVGAGAGPEGSAQLEHAINEFIRSQGHEPRGTDFTGRSDYGPFIEAGIPSGGTFTGAEGIKSEEEAALWGGEPGVAYDACYHQACDDLENVSTEALGINVDVIAHAVGTYAWDTASLREEVPFEPTEGTAGSGGGLHDHDHDVTS